MLAGPRLLEDLQVVSRLPVLAAAALKIVALLGKSDLMAACASEGKRGVTSLVLMAT
jgi:hypothetical protein